MEDFFVLRWRQRRGREVPVVEKATASDRRYMLHRTTNRKVIESALIGCRKRLDDAKRSVAANEQHIADLEKMLENEKAAMAGMAALE